MSRKSGPLEEALQVYEDAVRLFGLCRGRLDGMAQRIEELSETLDGTLRTEPLDLGDNAGDD